MPRPLLLILSVAARLAWTYLTPTGANFVDLHVYLGGAAAIDHPGTLYSYVYADQTPDFPLPFTYPPFAAVVFYPLHLLPFGLVAFVWQVGTMVALYGAIRISQRLLGIPADRRVAMVWTAVSIWIEPLRSTFDYGQINVFLMLGVLWAVYTTRWWLSGLLVGIAAGIKLTPAISGIYFAGARRWREVVFFGGRVRLPPSACRHWSSAIRPAITSPTCWATRAGLGPSPPRSTNPGAARSPGSSATMPASVRWCWPRSRSPRWLAVLAWRALDGLRSAGQVAGGRVVRAAVLADLVDPPLGVAGAADDLGHCTGRCANARAPALWAGAGWRSP